MAEEILRKPRGASYALVLLRIWTGVWLLWAGIQKLNAAYFNTGFTEVANKLLEGGAISFYKPFLTGMVISHSKVFAALTAGGEVLAGIGLILGFLTPLASIGVLIIAVNYLFAGWYFGPANMGLNITMIVLSISFLVGGAGRTLGLDSKFL